MGQRLPPGFRFHPTDVELVAFYLKGKIMGRVIEMNPIAVVDLYMVEPWDLPAMSALPGDDREWYFYCARDRKYANGMRTNRATERGYWKSTGKDRVVQSTVSTGMKKTLVYHTGRAPRGQRTDWVMHEYRMEDAVYERLTGEQEPYVLVRVFQKSGVGPRIGEQYGAPFVEEALPAVHGKPQLPVPDEPLPGPEVDGEEADTDIMMRALSEFVAEEEPVQAIMGEDSWWREAVIDGFGFPDDGDFLEINDLLR